MVDTEELRIEGRIAALKGLRIGDCCLEAADEIDRLRSLLGDEGTRMSKPKLLIVGK